MLLAIAVATPIAAPAQTNAIAKVGAVHIKGLNRFAEGQVTPLVDISPGSTFDASRLDLAMQTLGATGAFDEVRYSYRPENGAVTIDFIVKEAARFRRCTFDNFAFAPEDEVESAVRKRVPLFDGTAPDAGSMLDDIAGAAQAFAKTRGVSATVEHISFNVLGSPELEYIFRLVGPAIRISTVRFSGSRQIPETKLIQEAKPLLGRDYSIVNGREFARTVFVPYYRERGFLKVKIGESTAKLAETAKAANAYDIQVEYPVTEGISYAWSGPAWKGNQILDAGTLDSLLLLKPGETANAKKIESSWEIISDEYSRHGYIQAKLQSSADFDDLGRKVRFEVQVSEGSQFKMGAFSATGAPPNIAQKLQSKWKIKAGEIFDGTYLNEFMKKEAFPIFSNATPKPAKLGWQVVPNVSQFTVDVNLKVE